MTVKGKSKIFTQNILKLSQLIIIFRTCLNELINDFIMKKKNELTKFNVLIDEMPLFTYAPDKKSYSFKGLPDEG